ncbi:MAG: DUF3047 domain-containing protein [Alphaproteobacteria bacterium]
MANPIEELLVVGRLLGRRLTKPRTDKPAPAATSFAADFAATDHGNAKAHTLIALPSNQPPWFDTGLEIASGDVLTILATGRTELSKMLDIWVGAGFQVWARIGENGPIFRGTRPTNTVTADKTGRLYLATSFPGEWANKDGELGSVTPPEVYNGIKGDITVGVLNWGDQDGLANWPAQGVAAQMKTAELDRRAAPYQPPEGWQYLWYLGDAEIFHKQDDGTMCCHTNKDASILQREVDFPLTPDTHIDWAWLIEQLPATIREDTLPTHDYLSVAVEFDDGQDITYHWSAELPVERVYTCPLPTWKDKETHLIVRSGPKGLKEWQQERRNLHDDYIRAIGQPKGLPTPKRIVKVWLIAVSIFQRGEGRCEYRDIKLSDRDTNLQIL